VHEQAYLVEFGGLLVLLAPDHEVVTWTAAERAKGQAWGLKTIETFHTHGTPPVDPPAARG
jgi:catechol 2,3-dioxygenase